MALPTLIVFGDEGLMMHLLAEDNRRPARCVWCPTVPQRNTALGLVPMRQNSDGDETEEKDPPDRKGDIVQVCFTGIRNWIVSVRIETVMHANIHGDGAMGAAQIKKVRNHGYRHVEELPTSHLSALVRQGHLKLSPPPQLLQRVSKGSGRDMEDGTGSKGRTEGHDEMIRAAESREKQNDASGEGDPVDDRADYADVDALVLVLVIRGEEADQAPSAAMPASASDRGIRRCIRQPSFEG
ncbi:hypothetical protein DFH06DRAFT_1136903 [Mycena polygramma]|nr:hypothetical protein DFH06DRAFT_1136903 [Mycena polygramma]